MEKNAIVIKNVSMKFKLRHAKVDTFKEYLLRLFRQDLTFTDFFALKNINFTVTKGERLGIIGHNGAGKSTLLKIISGIYKPTNGNIAVNGSIAPLLELGAGFDPEYTGYDNIFLNGAILGLTKQLIESKIDEIIKFAELGEFIDVPLKNYSSGMRAKLGFSIATHINPDILIVDEVLGVGDEHFRVKSSNKIKELINSGNTVLLVSHRLSDIEEFAERVIWLDNGIIKDVGEAKEICDCYRKFMKNK